MNEPEKYILLEKKIGETPLECLENWRSTRPELVAVPMAYAGRLDPMASGKLLILIGEECKHQEKYHDFDKAYTFNILLGVSSDSGDILGNVKESDKRNIDTTNLTNILHTFVGEISLPYPIFSSRTVKGKPLHTWAMEDRLTEIDIPVKTSTVYKLETSETIFLNRKTLVEKSLQKINLIPPVTDPRKALGNDFRRPLVRNAWDKISNTGKDDDIFTIITINCIASSGTYMRSLAEEIAKKLGTSGLAFSIHRSEIGHYNQTTGDWDERLT